MNANAMNISSPMFCGANGCVLKYCCLKESCSNKITKIFITEKARNEELEIYKELKLNDIDIKQEYFIGDFEDCNIKKSSLSPENFKKLTKSLG